MREMTLVERGFKMHMLEGPTDNEEAEDDRRR